jgi:hypothetical protein
MARRNVGRNAARGGEIERSLVGRAEKERAALRPHVVAAQGEQSVHHLPRVVGRGVQGQHTVDQVERARLLSERLTAPVQLHVRLLELVHRGRDLLLHRVGPSAGAARILERLGRLALQRE